MGLAGRLLFQGWEPLKTKWLAEFWKLPEPEQEQALDELLLMIAEVLERKFSACASQPPSQKGDEPPRGPGLN